MSEEKEHVTVTKEIGKKKPHPLDEFTTFESKGESPAKALVEGLTKEEVRKMVEEPKPAAPTPEPAGEEIALAIDTSKEAQIVVSDLSKRYGLPGSLILVFGDRKTGRRHPYITKEGMGMMLERKKYARIEYRKGEKNDPAKLRFHYVCSIYPNPTKEQIKGLELLADLVTKGLVMRDDFLVEYRKVYSPIDDDGYASSETVRMRTMRTEYNLERLAKTRAYRHAAALYTGAGFGVMGAEEKEIEEEAEEQEEGEAPLTIDAKAEDVPPKGASP